MRDLRARAESLCRAVAPDVANGPLYVVFPADLPPDYRDREDGLEGCTIRHLDLILRPELERSGRWRGRGPAMLIDPGAIAAGLARRPAASRRRAFGRSALGVVLHELAHIIDSGPVETDPPDVLVAEARCVLAAELDAAEPSNGPNATIPWRWHEWSFIRITLHLAHRAATRRLDLSAADVFSASDHGLTSIWRYAAALGDEPERLAGQDFLTISRTPPPAAFTDLWEADMRTWASRFPTTDEFWKALAGCGRRILIP